MKYLLSIFSFFIFINSFAQGPAQSDSFGYETFSYLKRIDSADLPQSEKNKLEFEKISQYLNKRPKDDWYGLQLLWFNKNFDTPTLDSLFHLLDTSTQNQIAGDYNFRKTRSGLLPGSIFPEMILLDASRHASRVSDLKGKVVLIDIWASWCKPCRTEMPELISIYEKYKNKQFVVVAISIDEHKEDWLKAIHDDSLPWMHFCDLVDPTTNMLGNKWGINSIPYNFLIDRNGIMADKAVPLDKLEKELLKLL